MIDVPRPGVETHIHGSTDLFDAVAQENSGCRSRSGAVSASVAPYVDPEIPPLESKTATSARVSPEWRKH
jgi:hypothetical protein